MTTKPDDIPQDIWDAALSVYRNLWNNRADDLSEFKRGQDVEEIARAILAERSK